MIRKVGWTLLTSLLPVLLLFVAPVLADDSECFECHGDSDMARSGGLAGELFVDAKLFASSVHGPVGCADCHPDAELTDDEHPADLKPVNCAECHEKAVHVNVIKEKLWLEKDSVPACIDCHAPHRVRRSRHKVGLTDGDCMACHEREDLVAVRDGREVSVHTDRAELYSSTHGKLTCTMCHSNVFRSEEPPCKHVGPVDCATCHAEASQIHADSIHGQLKKQGHRDAPGCVTCHGAHGTLASEDSDSPTNVRKIPDLCGRCHRDGEAAARLHIGEESGIVSNFRMSIHGKGLLESGLVVTAECTACHTAHGARPTSDPLSSVAPGNVAQTCANCHAGILEEFQRSIHSPDVSKSDARLPVCNDCHSSHHIERVDATDFRAEIQGRCGQCHAELTEAYFDTYHGKVSRLGEEGTAKCSDCHSAHSILPPSDPRSTLSRENIVATCGKCHEGSHRRFAGYLSHATHKNPDKYPVLYYTFWFMTFLLVGTMAFFTLHTLLWLPRSIRVARERRRRHQEGETEPHVLRFVPYTGSAHS